MLIGIDGNEANVERRVGIGEYAFELLLQFKRSAIDDLQFTIYLKDKPLGHMPQEAKNWRYRVFGPKKAWTQFALPFKLLLGNPRPDVFFSPSHYAPRFTSIPSAISIMDVSYLLFPELFDKKDLYQLKNWTNYSVKNARKIFTISEASKNDIIKLYNVEPEKVVVTHPGVKGINIDKASNMNPVTKFNIDSPYILYVGTLQPRKNVTRLIEAFSKFKIQNSKFKLVVVGKRGWKYEEILEAPKKFGVEDKVMFLESVSDADLPGLYENAICFVLPSLYEGFGLPVVEAMKYGCPVLTSNVSSLPEAGGDAAIYFNPDDVNDIAGKLQKVISDKKLREEMKGKGFNQIKKFSWEKAAAEVLKELQSL